MHLHNMYRPLAKDGINRSFAAVYDGQHSPDAAKGAADRLHLILQREEALVAKNSGNAPFQHFSAMALPSFLNSVPQINVFLQQAALLLLLLLAMIVILLSQCRQIAY